MACRELRRKIPFFIAATLDTLKIISPTDGQHINTDTNFYTEVKVPKGGGKKVYVYMDDYFLGSFSAVYTPSSGTLLIPNNILCIGTTFLIVDGVEVPIGNTKDVTLTYRTKKYSARVSVVVEGNRNWNDIKESVNVKVNPDENIFNFTETCDVKANLEENIFTFTENVTTMTNPEKNIFTFTENVEVELLS